MLFTRLYQNENSCLHAIHSVARVPALNNMKHAPPSHCLHINSDSVSETKASTKIHSSNEANVHNGRSRPVHIGSKINHSKKLILPCSSFYSCFLYRITVACSKEMQTKDHRFHRFCHLDPSKQ